MGPNLEFRTVIAARKLGQSATACMLMMTRGDLASITLGHWLKAGKTGCLAALFAVLLTFTPIANLYSKKWALAAIAGVSTFFADWLSHGSSAPKAEAALTGVGAFVLSFIVSMTPIGARIEQLAAKVRDPSPPPPPTA